MMASPGTAISNPDPLAAALAQKTRLGNTGTVAGRMVATGAGWGIADMICTCGPRDAPFEERSSWVSIALVLSGTFHYRSDHGAPPRRADRPPTTARARARPARAGRRARPARPILRRRARRARAAAPAPARG